MKEMLQNVMNRMWERGGRTPEVYMNLEAMSAMEQLQRKIDLLEKELSEAKNRTCRTCKHCIEDNDEDFGPGLVCNKLHMWFVYEIDNEPFGCTLYTKG